MLTASDSKNTSVVKVYGLSSNITSSKPMRRPRLSPPRSIGTGQRSSTAWVKTSAQRLRASVTLSESMYGTYITYARSSKQPVARESRVHRTPEERLAPSAALSSSATVSEYEQRTRGGTGHGRGRRDRAAGVRRREPQVVDARGGVARALHD